MMTAPIVAGKRIVVVGPVPRVAEALEMITVGPLDGALLDINLNGEMAYAFADALTERQGLSSSQPAT